MKKQNILIFSGLIIIILLSAFFRLWILNDVPPGLYPDEAMNGNDALKSLENNDFKIFYKENNGREGLIIWLNALAFYIFGPDIWTLRLFSALSGILTVLGIFLLTSLIFNNKLIGLLSSFFLTISFWHINFSRIGFRGIFVPFFLVYGFYFVLKAFKTKKIYQLIAGGLFLGLGFYSYISYRFAVILLFFVLFFFWKEYKKENKQKEFFSFALILLSVIFVVALPIGIYFLLHPADFLGRAGDVSIFKQKNPLWSFIKAVFLHLIMFNFHGDNNWRHYYAGSPQLFWPIGIFFVLGLIIIIKKLSLSLNKKMFALFDSNKNFSPFFSSIFLLSWTLIFLFPGFLSAEGNPHSLRVIGVIPPIYIFSALGVFWLFRKIRKFYHSSYKQKVFYFLTALFFLVLAYAQFNRYFFDWSNKKEVENAFSKSYKEIGIYLNSLSPNLTKYVIVNAPGAPVPYPDGLPMPAQSPIFIEKSKYNKTRAIYLKPEELDTINPLKKSVVVFMREDEDLFAKTLILFPKDVFYKKDGFWVLEIKEKSL